MKVVNVAQMRELEAATFAAGTSEAELQERAGRAVTHEVLQLYPGTGAAVALVGPGNNGRDAWIAARGLLDAGWSAALYLIRRHSLRTRELQTFAEAGGRVIWHPDQDDNLDLDAALNDANVVIDGLLGIGTRGPLRAPLDAIVAALNAYRASHPSLLVVAVDNPSGIDADSGDALGVAVRADATVVLGAAKQGLLTPRAVPLTGELLFADVGIARGRADGAELLDRASVRELLPERAADAHKGTFGRLLVVAGSERYVGAAYLASAAAVRTGAGVVTLAAPPWLRDVIASRLAEVTFLPLPDAGFAGEPDESARRVVSELAGFTALALGPGLSVDGGVGDSVEAILRARAKRDLPAVVDADALNVLAQRPGWQEWIGSGVILTPHAGELQRLTGLTLKESEQPEWDRVRSLAADWKVTLVGKGAFTAVGTQRTVWVQPRPNPALATAGTGDVLTGIIGGLLARGLAAEDAARLGVWVHAQAGLVAGEDKREGGMMASELLDEIPYSLAELRQP
jgi:ADP-dependent NAD(P)H-hydrate dehydratase / NAD(P)H-hydrate epimerase